MPWRTIVVAGLAACLGVWPAAACTHAAPGAPAPIHSTGPLALVTTYADGRVTESLVTPTGKRSWTPYFPRVAGWREPEGVLPVQGLDIRAKAEGDGIRVRVSVLRGLAGEVEDYVTETFVTAGVPTVVEVLERVGVRPVTFSVKPFAAPALHTPLPSSLVEGLVVEGVEPFLEPAPGYRITVRNHTGTGVVTLAFDTTAGGRPALRGQQGDPSAEVVVAPNAAYTFPVHLRSGRETGAPMATATPLDEVTVTGAIWADGRVAGDSVRMAPLLGLHRGRLSAVQAVIDILTQYRTGDPVARLRQVRTAIDALPVSGSATRPDGSRLPVAEDPAVALGRQTVRRRLVADIDRVSPTITPAAAHQWLDEALAASEAWRDRLRALFPAR